MKRKFITELHPTIGADVEMFHPRNLAQAKSLALNSERKTGGPKFFQPNAKTSQISSVPSNFNRFRRNENFSKDNNSSFQRPRSKWLPSHNNSSNTLNRNNFSGVKKGSGDAPTKSENPANEGVVRPLATIRCFFCHQKGHYADTCPQKTQVKNGNKSNLPKTTVQMNAIDEYEDEPDYNTEQDSHDQAIDEDYDPDYERVPKVKVFNNQVRKDHYFILY